MLVSRATETYSTAPIAVRRGCIGQPDRVVLGHDHPVNAEGVGRPEERAEVPGVLDLVQRQKKGASPRWPGTVSRSSRSTYSAAATRATTPWCSGGAGDRA
jgi:hypothetical protein